RPRRIGRGGAGSHGPGRRRAPALRRPAWPRFGCEGGCSTPMTDPRESGGPVGPVGIPGPRPGARVSSAYPSFVRVVEVGPRDGLQNEARPIAPEARARFALDLAGAGLRDIEVGAFVRPDRVPQM